MEIKLEDVIKAKKLLHDINTYPLESITWTFQDKKIKISPQCIERFRFMSTLNKSLLNSNFLEDYLINENNDALDERFWINTENGPVNEECWIDSSCNIVKDKTTDVIPKPYTVNFVLKFNTMARTLRESCLGYNPNSKWTITGEVHEDYYKWVNDFEASHPTLGFVKGDFEHSIVASSKEAYDHFVQHYPCEEWDYHDI